MPEFETEAMTATAAIEEVLGEFASGQPGVTGSALVTAEGELLAARLRPFEDGLVEGLTAMLAGVAERAASEMEVGALGQVIVRASEGIAVLLPVRPGAFLLVLATADARLGLVLHDATRVASRIAELFESRGESGGGSPLRHEAAPVAGGR